MNTLDLFTEYVRIRMSKPNILIKGHCRMPFIVGLAGGLGCIIRPIKWPILLDRFLLNSSGIQPLRRLCQSGPFPGNSRSLATSRMLAPKLKVINNIYVGIKKVLPT